MKEELRGIFLQASIFRVWDQVSQLSKPLKGYVCIYIYIYIYRTGNIQRTTVGVYKGGYSECRLRLIWESDSFLSRRELQRLTFKAPSGCVKHVGTSRRIKEEGCSGS